ncbi:hypothetical protein ACI2LO_14800 [Streptomyces sp. NPDC033754]|uniref:hypothetical protein n=1 Tax=unclassified Streptomyces TaxID=2593676 RepID=UPI0033E8618E
MHHTENRGHMGNARKLDGDAVLRARVALLGSGRLTAREELEAYRVLAEVSPRAYLPKLVQVLVHRGYDLGNAELRPALYAEAVAAARRFDAEVPNRDKLLRQALHSHELALFAVGRRAEGRAVCEELARTAPYGRLALVLAEEGRHAEAAELYGRQVTSGDADVSDWTLIKWAAELDAAGRREEALKVFGGLVDDTRHRAAEDSAPLASSVWKLNHYAGMLRAAGHRPEEAAARREALALLARLAQGGEPASRGDIRAMWVTLLALSGRPAEPAATPEIPLPPFGAYPFHGWSPDTREAYFGSVTALEREVVALSESGDLPELVTAHRRLTVRRALHRETRGFRDEEALCPLFDEGVALARRLPASPGTLAQALTDRSMFLAAVERYAAAHADFVEAVALLDGDTPPPIVTRT